MWLQQRLKGLPGLLSSSWARRLVASVGFLAVLSWYLGGLRFPPWGGPGEASSSSSSTSSSSASACLSAATLDWAGLRARGEALPLPYAGEAPGPPAVVGNGFLTLDVSANRLWVRPGGRGPPLAPAFAPWVQLRAAAAAAQAQTEAGAAAVLPRAGAVRRVRCLQLGGRAPVLVREDFVAHRRRPHVYLQRIRVANPTDRAASLLQAPSPPPADALAATAAQAGGRPVLLFSGRAPSPPGGPDALVAVAAEQLPDRVQVAPRAQLDQTLRWVVRASDPLDRPAGDPAAQLALLREAAREELAHLMEVPPQVLRDEHREAWDDLFVSGVEMKKINDAHTPSSETVNMTLYYVLSCSPTPVPNSPLGPRERDRMESSLNYADHCFSGHATMHAENLWPDKLASVSQVLQLSDLWKLTLQKRGCKALVGAGAQGMMQGMVLSFGGLQFTENHLQFQADPTVLHNSYSLHGIHYNDDLINLAVLLDAEGRPFLHVSVRSHGRPVRIYACEAGCLNEPVELTSESRGHTFPVMVTQPITPLLYISTDLTHLQDLRHTLHLKAILAHEEHMAKQYPGLPFLFWFSVASLITLFHLFLFKLIYNEYCGPGAKPLFRSKEDPSV
ncbi:LOW QUALITY PROTEIN: uncharacterized protein KIAA2013 homolog [Tachyglossus aculeatus]|uniref:LOW QUALITY PROTEIN: uncharacterized protein KIAA2013 homolog n=1 Tax=Tachyglossus aculeatus TaxID=9261 RepID=UPI0018F2FF8E|nr:LOW QUALITY PROTEIN: uncharacterized protein KIAA2013 homolog [Tachyglossus aculeatus]